MKFSCTRDNLHQGLSIVSHLSAKNLNLPILQNVLMKAEGGTLNLSSTNLEMAVRCAVRGKVEQAGECTVPAKLFFDYVSLLPNETVQVQVDSGHVGVVSGRYKTKMNTLPASEFPLIPSVQAARTYQVPAAELREALSRVLFAVASHEARPELTGVCLTFESQGDKGSLILAATDSYRLSEVTVPLPAGAESPSRVIVPSRTLGELHRILSVFRDAVDSPSSVTFKFSDNQLVVSYGPVELVSRLIEGNYPDYRQIIPKDFRTTSRLDREDFVQAVKAASLFSKNGLFDVTLSFDPKDGGLSVRSVDATRGENTAMCPSEVNGNANTVTVNYRYLLDGLSSFSTPEVMFQMIDAANPCVVTPKDGQGSLYIVMPIKQ
jgi:DNA polymerase-3 subunit beta